jgi:hypothetical protein
MHEKSRDRANRLRGMGEESGTLRMAKRAKKTASGGGAHGRATAKRSHRATARKTAPGRKWSAGVMARSDALDLESGVFKGCSAREVALSLKRSAEASDRKKSTPFRSAMSMLNFEINRAGKNLPADRKRVLNQAKVELRKVFHREPARS